VAEYLRVKNLAQFQHYKDRNPPWIKLHNEILHSRTWVTLDDASKALAIAIMLLASRTENKIPADPAYIQRVAYLHTLPDLQKLLDIDFIEIIELDENCKQVLASASKVLAKRTTETETDINNSMRKRGTRLTKDWEPSDDVIKWAINERTDLDIQKVLDSFTDYWVSVSGAKGVKLDWDATFRNWVRNQHGTGKTQPRTNETAVQRSERLEREAFAACE